MEAECFKFLADELPGFRVHGSQIKIIQEPEQFYQELINKISSSKSRIVMAALYLGTGKMEKNLVQRIGESLDREQDLRVKILLDWCRGTRLVDSESSASVLAPLKSQDDERCQVTMYHTPYLRGFLKWLLPSKMNEMVGLQHCKVYVFDDTLIMSGANLSRDYFTKRQDRYIVIEDCAGLADYYEDLVDTIGSFSLVMDKEQKFETSNDLVNHPHEGQLSEFINESSSLVSRFLEDQKMKNKTDLKDFDTIVFPSVQMGQLNITQDSTITSRLLRLAAESGGTFHLGTGYFNLTDNYIADMMDQSQSSFKLLMAHPQANGFLGARGLAGAIPSAYTLLSKNFWNLVLSRNMQDRIKMFEYKRDGWTYHAKGLWYSSSASALPCLTMVGSPNYGYRSVYKDLETQVTILSNNKGLQKQLGEEQTRVFKHSDEVDGSTYQQEDRRVPAWVKLGTMLARKFF